MYREKKDISSTRRNRRLRRKEKTFEEIYERGGTLEERFIKLYKNTLIHDS